MTLPTFDDTENVLRRANVLADAPEVHGILTGLLCGGKTTERNDWIDQTLAEVDPSNANVAECRRVLEQLWSETADALRGDALNFEPLLPDDDEDLQIRVDALLEWLRGFMLGIGLAEVEDFDKLPPDVSEVLKDIAEISRSELALGDNSEEDEAAYMELAEYARVGAQLVHDELNPARPTDHVAPPGLH
ncbi:MAG: UPF0149 family protein [Gammaproteobacteria bacterium]|nr:UPF0149 family protein [Gammaproteobacteria bacterium]